MHINLTIVCRNYQLSFFVYCGSNFDIKSINNFELLGKPPAARLFLTTYYLTSVTETHGDNGNKSAKEDVALSGKG